MPRIRHRFDPKTGLWWCPRCERFKPRDDFGHDKRRNEPCYYCRLCTRVEAAIRYHANPTYRSPNRKESDRRSAAKRAVERRKRASEYAKTPMGRLVRARSKARTAARDSKTEAARTRALAAIAWCDSAIARLKRAAEIEVPTCDRRRA